MNNVRKKGTALKKSTVGRGVRVAVVVSQFNKPVTDKLRKGALLCLDRQGVRRSDVRLYECSGAFELPQVANVLCLSGRFDAVVCLGAVVRGETPHFEFVSTEAARGIQEIALRYAIPVTFGVLTTDTMKQALDRAGGSQGNKGWDAALAAVEMAGLFRKVRRDAVRSSSRKGS